MRPNYIHDFYRLRSVLQEGQVSSSDSSGIQVNEGPYIQYIILMAAQSKTDSENHVSVTHKL